MFTALSLALSLSLSLTAQSEPVSSAAPAEEPPQVSDGPPIDDDPMLVIEAPIATDATTAARDDAHRQKLKELMEKREEAQERYADRAAIPNALDYLATVFSACFGIGAGLSIGGLILGGTGNPNGVLLLGTGACCTFLGGVATAGVLVGQIAWDHRASDLAAITVAQKEFEEEAMSY